MDDGSIPASEERMHHLTFAHRSLPGQLWRGEALLGPLAAANGSEWLQTWWEHVGSLYPADARVDASGLDHRWFEFEGAHRLVVITLPEPIHAREAAHVAIVASPRLRIFTLWLGGADLDGRPTWRLSEWTGESSLAEHGDVTGPGIDCLLASIASLLELLPGNAVNEARTASPRRQLEFPDSEAALPPLGDEEADMAVELWRLMTAPDTDPQVAEQVCHRLHAFWLDRAGPAHRKTINSMVDLSYFLALQGKHAEAEIESRSFWEHCRRHRQLGDLDTLLAVRRIAKVLQLQGRADEAREWLQYQCDLAFAVWGKGDFPSMVASARMASMLGPDADGPISWL